jgi:hypothetical protein
MSSHPEGVAVCGHSDEIDARGPWLALYDPSGELLWETTDLERGYRGDCWDVSTSETGEVAVVEWGEGARVAVYDSAGQLGWERVAPSTGTLAVDFAPNGHLFVGGWSADPETQPEPFRSHEIGVQAGWVLELVDGEPGWLGSAPVPSKIRDLRVHPTGFVTAVGSVDDSAACPSFWVARYDPEPGEDAA